MLRYPPNIFETQPAIFKLEKRAKCKHYLCKKTNRSRIYLGCSVYNAVCIVPPLSKCNGNVFRRSFGVKFELTPNSITATAVRLILLLEHASMFGYTDQIIQRLSKQKYLPLLEKAIPTQSSAAITNCIFKRLLLLRQSSVYIFNPTEP